MEIVTIEKDVPVLYVTAESFPNKIMDAYQELHSLIKDSNNDRMYFGISQPNEKGNIIYKAAAEELEPGEAEKYGCKSFTIKKGKYICIDIKNHMSDAASIGNAFQQLIAQPGIDPQGYCLEWYRNYTDPDVRCMVGLVN
jgi:predicted transcriptional regulator YdeE